MRRTSERTAGRQVALRAGADRRQYLPDLAVMQNGDGELPIWLCRQPGVIWSFRVPL